MQSDSNAITLNKVQGPHRARLVPRLLLLLTIALAGGAPMPPRRRKRREGPNGCGAGCHRQGQTPIGPVRAGAQKLSREDAAVPTPHRGCFVAHYPTATWKEMTCVAAPNKPSPVVKGSAFPNTVGAGTDNFSSVTGHLSSVTGSFDAVSNITPEYGNVGGDLTSVHPNVYELQMNSNIYTAPCPSPSGCQGWEQFLFSQTQCSGACVFIEYWLLNYPPPCPTTEAWRYYAGTPTTTPGCYFNTTGTRLDRARAGRELWTAADDRFGVRVELTQVQLTDGDGNVYTKSNPSVASLAGGWSGAEYNVFGDCCAANIVFHRTLCNITVRQATTNGSSAAPTCTGSFAGATAETNNLNLVGGCAASGGSAPAIVFTESGGGPVPPGVSIGDPHFQTFQSGHYTYMGAGEYILVQTPDLLVQARQARSRRRAHRRSRRMSPWP